MNTAPQAKRHIRKCTRWVDAEGFEFTLEPLEDTLTVTPTKTGFEARYITRDEDADSPDTWGDDNLFLVHYHRSFDVRRDKIIVEDEAAAICRGESLADSRHPDLLATYWVFPVSAYIHSGVVLSLASSFPMDGQGWDTSHVGLALVAKKEWPDEGKAREAASALVTEWNQYLSGEVYTIVKETYDDQKMLLDYDCVGGHYGMRHAQS